MTTQTLHVLLHSLLCQKSGSIIAFQITAGIQPLQIPRTQDKVNEMAGEGKGQEVRTEMENKNYF